MKTSNYSKEQSLLDLPGLYDFSLDIERHEDDGYFSDNGGEIHYVYDENIFEMFVYPHDNWMYVERSPSVFTGKRLTGRWDLRRRQDMQTALATAEILFGGKLPGQRHGKIYLTEWHRWELLARTNQILADYSGPNIGAFRDAAKSMLRIKLDYWSNELSSDELKFDPKGDPQVERDVEELNLRKSIDLQTLHSFVRNRDAAYVLANDKNVEPAQQLSRILDVKMQRRLKGVVSIARPKRSDANAVEASARAWARALKAEYDAQLIRNPNRRQRSGANLWSDARSIALVEWISEKIDSGGRRVVFVTGDGTLFDAYRRIYEGESTRRKRRTAPFILRRPLQYAPFFQSEVNSPIVKEKAELFRTVRHSVELGLVPVRLAAISRKKVSKEFLSRRHSVTLQPVEKNRVLQKSELDLFWDENKSTFKEQRISYTDEELATNERVLIGLCRELIERRFSKDEKQLFSEFAEWGDEQEKKFGEHIEQSIQRLLKHAIEVWQPIATSFFKKTLDAGNFRNKRKVPIAIKLAVMIGDAQIDFHGLMAKLVEDAEDHLPEDYAPGVKPFSSPFEVFLSSSAVALYSNEWRMADHFCEMAINAVDWPQRDNENAENAAPEAYYLSALAKRYRLGDMSVVQRFGAFVSAQHLYEEANDALDLYEQSAKRGYSLGNTENGSNFARLRCDSERAALHLFFTSLSFAFAEELNPAGGVEDIRRAAKKAHARAMSSFNECIRNPLVRRSLHDPETLEQGSVERLVMVQLVINACAWFGLGQALKSQGGTVHNPNLARFCMRNLAFLESETLHTDNPVFSLEVGIFKKMHLDPGDYDPEEVQDALELNPATLDLNIDSFLLSQLQDVWLELDP